MSRLNSKSGNSRDLEIKNIPDIVLSFRSNLKMGKLFFSTSLNPLSAQGKDKKVKKRSNITLAVVWPERRSPRGLLLSGHTTASVMFDRFFTFLSFPWALKGFRDVEKNNLPIFKFDLKLSTISGIFFISKSRELPDLEFSLDKICKRN